MIHIRANVLRRRLLRRRIWAGAVLAALALHALPGRAAEPATSDSAAALDADGWFQQGVDAYKANDLVQAEQCLRRAWELKKTYDIAGNFGQTLHKLGKMREASEVLAYTLSTFPPTAGAEKRQRIETMLAQAKAAVGTWRVTVNVPGAEVLVDGVKVGASPLATELYLEPGAHSIAAKLGGYTPATRSVEAKAGASEELALELKQSEAGGIAADEPLPLWPVGVGAGLTVALAVVGVVLRVTADGQFADAEALGLQYDQVGTRCAGGCAELVDAYSKADSTTNASTALFVVAGAAGLATVVYTVAALVTAGASAEPSSALRVIPVLTPGEGALALEARF